MTRAAILLLGNLFVLAATSCPAFELPANLGRDKLVAWCVVPFDARKRGPAERAAMLTELGLKRCAYDWRARHVAEFEEEILQYEKHGIEYFAFWGRHEEAFRLFRKHNLHPQIWYSLTSPGKPSQSANVAAAAASLVPLAEETAELGCKLGLYNHGGWGGEPANLVSVCQALHELGHKQVGIVYNWHHGHDHISDWPSILKLMQPYLHCLNLNGMNPGAKPKILNLGQGRHELSMLRAVIESGYRGPIGIIDHQSHLDTKEVLRDNLAGLLWLQKELTSPGSGGLRPIPSASKGEPR
ncbi:MAG: hypothetical protein CMP28_13150 [Roseibacillus sp.]|nr:hypothetical protein [Roseibacillus sp.]